MIKGIAKLLLALNGNVKKSQIAAGFAWGVLLGLVPASNVFWIVIFMITFFFAHNHASKISAIALIKALSPLFIYQIDAVGWYVLTGIETFQPFFTAMYNMPFVPFTNFNNTLVMGGLTAGIILWVPVFILFMAFIPVFRNRIAPKIRQSKIVKAIGKFPLLAMIDKAMKG